MPVGEGVEDRRREPSRRLPKRSQARRRPVEQTQGGFIFYVWWSKIEENDSCPSPAPPSTEFSLVAWSVTRVGEHKKSNFPPTSGYIFGQVRPSQALPRRRSWIPCIPLSIQAPPRLRRSPNPESGPESPGRRIKPSRRTDFKATVRPFPVTNGRVSTFERFFSSPATRYDQARWSLLYRRIFPTWLPSAAAYPVTGRPAVDFPHCGLEIWDIAGVLCRCSPRHRSREAACIASLHHLCIRVASDQFSGQVYDRTVGQSSTPQMTTRTPSMIDTSAWFATRRHARPDPGSVSFLVKPTQSWSGSIPHSGSNSTGISFIWASVRQDWSFGRRRKFFLIITLKNH